VADFCRRFPFSSGFMIARRLCSTLVAAIGLLLALPLLPFIMLAIKLDSSGPFCTPEAGRTGRRAVQLLQVLGLA